MEETLSDGTVNAYNTGFVIGYSKEYDTQSFGSGGIIDELASYDGIDIITSPDEVYEHELPDTYAKRDITVRFLFWRSYFFCWTYLIRRFP